MGSVVNGLFGGSSSMPSIEVEDAVLPPTANATVDPVSSAVREMEKKRLKARRAFAGTLLTGKSSEDKSSTSLL